MHCQVETPGAVLFALDGAITAHATWCGSFEQHSCNENDTKLKKIHFLGECVWGGVF